MTSHILDRVARNPPNDLCIENLCERKSVKNRWKRQDRPNDVLDEIASRTMNSDGDIIGVRSNDIPGGWPVAALLRYGV